MLELRRNKTSNLEDEKEESIIDNGEYNWANEYPDALVQTSLSTEVKYIEYCLMRMGAVSRCHTGLQ